MSSSRMMRRGTGERVEIVFNEDQFDVMECQGA